MKRYPVYKDSGIEWLGEIPEHWQVKRLKLLAKIKNGQDYKLVHTYEPIYPVIGSGGQFAYASQYLFKGESVLLGRKGTVDKPLYVNCAFWTVDTMFYTKINNNTFPKFLYYSALTIPFEYLFTNTTVPSMTQDDLGNHLFAFAPLEEQKAIAHFLDHKLEQIEQYIRNKKQLIELLNEQKTAIINRAVTKGINPNAPMKHSGIEWLGEIPAHWELKRNKYIFREVNERSTTGQETYLAMSQRLGLVERSQIAEQHLSTSENQIGYKLCQVNDLILNKLKAYLGVFFKASVSGLVSPDYTVFRPITDIEVEYFEYLFKTPGYIAEFNKLSTGIVIGFFRLYTPDFYTSYSIFPPVEEQTKIVNYIKHESSQIHLAIAQIEKEIELIQEYRTTLISDAVTGKIDVRGFDNSSNSRNSPKPPELATM